MVSFLGTDDETLPVRSLEMLSPLIMKQAPINHKHISNTDLCNIVLWQQSWAHAGIVNLYHSDVVLYEFAELMASSGLAHTVVTEPESYVTSWRKHSLPHLELIFGRTSIRIIHWFL